MNDFSAEFEPEFLAVVARMEGWQASFAPVLQRANEDSADVIIAKIPTVTSWQNGTGTLDGSFYQLESTPYSIRITSDVPYAARQHYGWDAVDSLGRRIPTPATHFVDKAIEAASSQVEDIYAQYTQQAFDNL